MKYIFFFPIQGQRASCPAFCLLFVEPNKRWASCARGKGEAGGVFSVCKALDPGLSVMAAEEILPQISYRTPAAVRRGMKPEYPGSNSNRPQSSSPLAGCRTPNTKYPVPVPFEAREKSLIYVVMISCSLLGVAGLWAQS